MTALSDAQRINLKKNKKESSKSYVRTYESCLSFKRLVRIVVMQIRCNDREFLK